MPAPITIRRATTADRDLLVELGRRTFFDTFVGTCSDEDMELFLAESFAPDKVAAELALERSDFYLALDAGAAVLGYARLYEEASPPEFVSGRPALELVRFYLLQEAIGKGVAAPLMEHCLAVAKQRGYASIYLGVWERNYRAQRFYAKFGFSKCGQKIFMVGRDAQTDWYFARTL
jgi:ribosomal protein S18 acetylase RimI-like enzyme